MYNNIPNDEGLTEFREALDSRQDKSISTDFLVELLELVLTLNISEFDKKRCLKCKKQYVGQTGRSFYTRGMEHLRSVRAKEKTIGIHFSSECKNDDMKMQIIEKVFPNNETFRLERERYWIGKLRTKNPHGLNMI